jgi:hypothetical protein
MKPLHPRGVMSGVVVMLVICAVLSLGSCVNVYTDRPPPATAAPDGTTVQPDTLPDGKPLHRPKTNKVKWLKAD